MRKERWICVLMSFVTLILSSALVSLKVEAGSITEKDMSINIDNSIFNDTQIRLNTEIYNITSKTFNKEHIIEDFGEPESNLAMSYVRNVNPLIPIAISINETGMWADSRYTWSPAVYSKLLASSGCDMNRLKVETVNVDTYIVNGLGNYYGCGTNCTAPTSKHYHTFGHNDNDSLGPLQILRHYVEAEDYILYDCGDSVMDLMSWTDNVKYFTHTQSKQFMDSDNWNKNHCIKSDCELVALMATAHNTGTAYLTGNDAGSLWNDSDAVYDYCSLLGDSKSIEVMNTYVDEWWNDVIVAQASNEKFILLGQYPTDKLDNILNAIGTERYEYASNFKHKQYYPLKAVLNYLCLKKLYYSGGEN